MKPLYFKILNLIVVPFIPTLALAQQPDSAATEQLIDSADRPLFTTPNALPAAQHNDAPKAKTQPEHRLLPIWGMKHAPVVMICRNPSGSASTT